MMLRSKGGSVSYTVKIPSENRSWEVHPKSYLTDNQYKRMIGKPDMILELAHHIADEYRAQGYEDVEVYGTCVVYFNGRRGLPFIDTSVNLAAEKRSVMHYTWVLPLVENEEE